MEEQAKSGMFWGGKAKGMVLAAPLQEALVRQKIHERWWLGYRCPKSAGTVSKHVRCVQICT